jgi:hypothetical protein
MWAKQASPGNSENGTVEDVAEGGGGEEVHEAK